MKNSLLVLLTLLSFFPFACSETPTPEPMVVQVFGDPDAYEIGTALLALGRKQLKASDGRPIMIAHSPMSYADGLGILGRQTHPDVVILNSPEDGEAANIDASPRSVVEVSGKRFYLAIPSWVPEERRQTAEQVLIEMQAELQNTGRPSGP